MPAESGSGAEDPSAIFGDAAKLKALCAGFKPANECLDRCEMTAELAIMKKEFGLEILKFACIDKYDGGLPIMRSNFEMPHI